MGRGRNPVDGDGKVAGGKGTLTTGFPMSKMGIVGSLSWTVGEDLGEGAWDGVLMHNDGGIAGPGKWRIRVPPPK